MIFKGMISQESNIFGKSSNNYGKTIGFGYTPLYGSRIRWSSGCDSQDGFKWITEFSNTRNRNKCVIDR